jgi:hypothetical protein
VAPPVFKTGLAGNTLAGRFDSFPPPPQCQRVLCEREDSRATMAPAMRGRTVGFRVHLFRYETK